MNGPELERVLFHWHAVIKATPRGWAKDFALSIQRNQRRRNWKPTAKQAQIMRTMVADLFSGSDARELIE